MAICAALLAALFLPETLNRPLPQTVKEVESWSMKYKKGDNDCHSTIQKTVNVIDDTDDEDTETDALRSDSC